MMEFISGAIALFGFFTLCYYVGKRLEGYNKWYDPKRRMYYNKERWEVVLLRIIDGIAFLFVCVFGLVFVVCTLVMIFALIMAIGRSIIG